MKSNSLSLVKLENENISVNLKERIKLHLIADYAHVVAYVANKLAAKLPASVDINDLMSSGFIGLLAAIEKYDPSKHQQFRSFCQLRIRGAMLDELRYLDIVPRSVRDRIKEIEATKLILSQQLGRKPSKVEVAEYMGLSLDEYNKLITYNQQLTAVSLTKFDSSHNAFVMEPIDPETEFTQEDYVISRQNSKRMLKLIRMLPKQQAKVVELYFYQNMTLLEVAKILKVSESRVSQIRTKALKNLKSIMSDLPRCS